MNIKLKSKIARDERGMHLVSADATVDGKPVDFRYSISTGANIDIAKRLCRAIDAGVVFTECGVLTDVNGGLYISHHCHVLGRRLNADLIRLGY